MSALDVACGMAASCATVQTLLGIDTEEGTPAERKAAALALCVADDAGAFDWLDDGTAAIGMAYDGSALTLEPPLLIVEDAGTEGEPLAGPQLQVFRGALRIVVVATPAAADIASTPATRWARSQQLAILDELQAQAGSTTAFSRFSVAAPRPYTSELRDGPFADCWHLPLDLSWE